ncbi:MAG: type II secretion system GspH family protein [Armatimonadetes bacterium]|nr:type II secretion system GspH family protein [Armatimonadota bacterium]
MRISSKGFTIIELLVVIAISALLSGLLFPVIITARMACRKSQCATNLKQIGIAFDLYTNDWDGVFPCPGGRYGDLSYWDQEGNGGIRPYLKERGRGEHGLLCCPAYNGRWRSKYSPRTYSMNEYLRWPPDIPYPQCIKYLCGIPKRRIMQPERTILLYEGIPADEESPFGEGFVYRCGNWEWVMGYRPTKNKYWQSANRPMHARMNNYLMCDGHVITMEPEKYPFAPSGPANNLWYVTRLR